MTKSLVNVVNKLQNMLASNIIVRMITKNMLTLGSYMKILIFYVELHTASKKLRIYIHKCQ